MCHSCHWCSEVRTDRVDASMPESKGSHVLSCAAKDSSKRSHLQQVHTRAAVSRIYQRRGMSRSEAREGPGVCEEIAVRRSL